jgi:subtilisin family serine protease
MPDNDDSQATLSIEPVEPPRQFDDPQLGLSLTEVDRLIRANEARNVFGVDGSGSTAVIVDTGINAAHVDFAGRLRAQVNFTSDNGGADDDAADGNGHGTNVAGIVAADGDHRGVAPGAGLVAIKVLANNGSGSFTGVASALDWVIEHHQEHAVTAVCMSLSAGDNRPSDAGLSQHDVAQRIATLRERRIPVVIAAGNDYFTHGSKPGMAFPAILRHAVSVGAVYDEFEGPFDYSSGARAFQSGPDRITPFSQRLHETVDSICRTDVFAPGAPVTSSGINGPRGESVQQGTSQAAPVTVGVILLMQELFVRLTGELPEVDELVEILRQSAVVIHDGDDESDNVEHTNQDYPRIDCFAALDAIGRRLQRRMLETGEPLRPAG